eukprot:57772-Chlamydomonas_euryale.AAC.3
MGSQDSQLELFVGGGNRPLLGTAWLCLVKRVFKADGMSRMPAMRTWNMAMAGSTTTHTARADLTQRSPEDFGTS